MKKIILVNLLALAISGAIAQTGRMQDNNSGSVTSLDRKSYKVTLVPSTADAMNNQSMNSSQQNPDNTRMGTANSRMNNSNTGTNQSGMNQSSTNQSGTTPDNTSSGNSTLTPDERIQQGKTTTDPLNNEGTNQSTTGRTSTTTSGNNSSTSSGNRTSTQPETGNNSDRTSGTSNNTSNTTMSEGTNSLANKTMIIRFENGMINSSNLTSEGMSCPFTITKMETSKISFNSNCKNDNQPSSGSSAQGNTTRGNMMWNGTVDGKNIKGTVSMNTDGQQMVYTFTGMETTEKDSKYIGEK